MSSELEAGGERSVPELLGTLGRDIGKLLRQELELAGTEMGAKTTRVAHASRFLAIGGAAIHLGAAALLAAIVAGMALVMPVWLAALVASIVVSIAGYLVLRAGIEALRRIDPVPRQAVREVRTDTTLVKESLQ